MFQTLLYAYWRFHLRLRWERRWASDEYRPRWLTNGPRAFVVDGFDTGWLSVGKSVLDIGCGAGHTAAWLASHGLHVVGIDCSRHAIARAAAAFRDQPGLRFQVVDVCGPDRLGKTFDVLIDGGCLHIIPKPLHHRYVRNLLLWSRPGSRYVVTMKTSTMVSREWADYLQSLLSPAFEMVHFEERPSNVADRSNPVVHMVRRPNGLTGIQK